MTNIATSLNNTARCWLFAGAFFAATGVILGAFGAHGIDKVLVDKYTSAEPKIVAGQELAASYKYLQDFKTGTDYQMYHALGLLLVGVLSITGRRKSLQWAGWSFVIGILLFSGSLYLLVLTGNTKLGMVAPLGGTALIVGWSILAVSFLMNPAVETSSSSESPA